MDWGAWHKSNFEDRHVTDCFDDIYKTNSIGARDDEFNLNGAGRTLLLGDSAAEGYGDARENTIEKRIEDKTGVSVLNFGSGGNFGPAQYYLLYQKMAKNYQHEKLVIMFAPSNDFIDNDLDEMKKNGMANHVTSSMRYRPYIKNYEPYDIFYPEDSVKQYDYGVFSQGIKGKIKMFILNYFWFSNPLKSVYFIKTGQTTEKLYSGYYDSAFDQQKAVISVMDRLFNEAKGKKIILVMLASKYDVARYQEDGDKYKDQYWYKKLQEREQNDKNFKLVDAIAQIKGDFFKSCDGHYSDKGSRVISELIISNMN
jgi:hypothetical protein